MKYSELLLADYQHFNESLLQNEQGGEGRVKFLGVLITVVGGAVGALATANPAAMLVSIDLLRRVAAGSAGALLVFGVLSYLRMLQRDRVTDEYKRILNGLRVRMASAVDGLHGYELEFIKPRHRLLNGGYAITVATLNVVLAAVAGALVFPGKPLIAAGIGALLAFGLHVLLFNLTKLRPTNPVTLGLNEPPSPADGHFRAGVGAIILNSRNEVLAFERADHAGSWQLPQGGIEADDGTLEEALYREVWEETGLKRDEFASATPLSIWVGYELPVANRSAKTGRGQVHRWFVMRLRDDSAEPRLRPGGEFCRWQWKQLNGLGAITAPFRQPVYEYLVRQF